MAYKFQLGAARLSGSVVQEGDVTAESSQLNAATIDLDDASGIAGAGLEDQSGDLGIADLGVTNAMLAGNIASSKIAELNAFDTADLAEGSNLYYTDARSRAAVSVTDAGGDGSLSYDSGTGVITYTGPSAAEVRAHLSVADSTSVDMSLTNGEFSAAVLVDDSSLEIDATNGVQVKALGITNAMLAGNIASSKIAELNAFDTADLAEGSNLYYTDARVHAAVSVADSNSIDMSYDGSGQFSADAKVDDSSIEIDATNGLQVKALGITNAMLSGAIASSKIAELNAFDTGDLAEGSNLYYTEARWDAKMAAADTGDLAEGSNLYYTDARARAAVSVTDNGGDGSLSYDSGTGVISYTGPSASEVRAHFSVADSNSIDMSYSAVSGEFSADALVDSAALEVVAGGISLKSSISGSRTFQHDLTVSGDLTVNGALTYVNTTNLAISDALITIASGSSAFAVDYGLEFGAVGGGWASIKTAQEDLDGDSSDDDIFKFSHPISSSIMAAEAIVASEIYGDLQGSIAESIQVITAGTAFDAQNTQVLCNFAANDSVTLPSPSAMEGKVYKFKKIGNGNVQLNPNGSETIDGASSILLESPYAGVSIISDGSNYFVM